MIGCCLVVVVLFYWLFAAFGLCFGLVVFDWLTCCLFACLYLGNFVSYLYLLMLGFVWVNLLWVIVVCLLFVDLCLVYTVFFVVLDCCC